LGEKHRDVINDFEQVGMVQAMKGNISQAVTLDHGANEIRAHDIDENLADTSERQSWLSSPAYPIN